MHPKAVLLICRDALKLLDGDTSESLRYALKANARMMFKVITGEFPKDSTCAGKSASAATMFGNRLIGWIRKAVDFYNMKGYRRP